MIDTLSAIFERIGMKEGENIESRMVSRAIESSQKRVEGRNFEIRKHLLEYDDVMNSQREFIYSKRNDILENDIITDKIDEYIKDSIYSIADMFSYEKKYMSEWEMVDLTQFIKSKFGINFIYDDDRHSKCTDEDFVGEMLPAVKAE